jgi:hypothetical protein
VAGRRLAKHYESIPSIDRRRPAQEHFLYAPIREASSDATIGNQKRCPRPSANEHLVIVRFDALNVLRLKSFWAFRDIELHSLAFLQAAEAAA